MDGWIDMGSWDLQCISHYILTWNSCTTGRFEESVIEERRQSALGLLNFAGKDPHLFTSASFVSFFEVSQHVLCLECTLYALGLSCNLLEQKDTIICFFTCFSLARD